MMLLRPAHGLRACSLHTLAPLTSSLPSVAAATHTPLPAVMTAPVPRLPLPTLGGGSVGSAVLKPVRYQISADDFLEASTLKFTPTSTQNDGGDKTPTAGDDGQPSSPPSRSSKPDPAIMEDVAAALCLTLNGFFTRKLDLRIFREDIVFENRIKGTQVESLFNYGRFLHLVRIWGNVRFVYVSCKIKEVHIDNANAKVIVHFQGVGIGMTKMFLNYIPKKLWRHKNLADNATVLGEAISTYYVDGEGYIYRHVLDNKDVDKDKPVSKLEEVKEKLEKLKGVPNPTM